MQKNFLHSLRDFVVYAIVFLFPLFFLPFTRDFLIITKFYFFIYAVLILFTISFVHFVTTKKITIYKSPFASAYVLILIAILLSTILVSPNTIQALMSPRFGFILIAAVAAFSMYVTNVLSDKTNSVRFVFLMSSLVVAIFAIIAAIQPFGNQNLGFLSFLNSPDFNTVGSQLELSIFLGLALVLLVDHFISLRGQRTTITTHQTHTPHRHQKTDDMNIVYLVFFVVIAIALSLTLYLLFKSVVIDDQRLLLTPWRLSWFAAVEIFKNPVTTFFGVGVDNYAAIFTQVKDIPYNLSELWQITVFIVSRSALLHIITEAGLIALIGVILLFVTVYQSFSRVSILSRMLVVYSSLMIIFFPPSLVVFYIFFLSLAFYGYDLLKDQQLEMYTLDLSNLLPLYISGVVVYLVAIGLFGFFLTRILVSEFMFGQALQALQRNDLQQLYNYQRSAVLYNINNELFRREFAQTNLIVANNISSQEPDEITEQDRLAISESIQGAINEAKAAVALNSQNVINIQHLASIYRNIINVAEGATDWTIAAYQRAIFLDPQNPSHRVELGGIYYLAEEYDQAERLFEQAVNLKGDWGNAHYNLAWTYYQKQQYPAAVRQMQIVLSLLDPQQDEADFKQAEEDLETFKANLPPEEPTEGEPAEGEAQPEEPENLNLPEAPEATFEPKIELPEDAAPPEGDVEGVSTDEVPEEPTEEGETPQEDSPVEPQPTEESTDEAASDESLPEGEDNEEPNTNEEEN